MNTALTEALNEVRNAGRTSPFDEERYLAACNTIVDHRDELSHRVYINLPGGLAGNGNYRWSRVREHSTERCSCGNERVILPGKPRTDFEASKSEPVVVSGDEKSGVYLRPIGGDKTSTHMKLWIDANGSGSKALAFMAEPFAPFVISASMFSTQGYDLAQLAAVLPKQTKPAVMFTGQEKTPIFAIRAVDPEAGTATIVLDKDVEFLTEEELEREPTHAR